jgi:6-pyruvoyl-tetrahydropterin synthase
LFTVSIETQFKASHRVKVKLDSLEPEHEHFWGVTVIVSSEKLDVNGVAVDFAWLKARVTDITSQLAGSTLNEIDYFRQKSATAECVAMYVFEHLEPILSKGVRLEGVTVSEQVGCSAKYHK